MDRKTLLFATRAVLGLFWAGAVALVLRGLTDNPLRLSRDTALNLVAVSPQGWAFFTRSPREAAYHVFRRDGAEWAPYPLTNAHPVHAFGASRAPRAKEMELGAVLGTVPGKHWREGRVLPGVPAGADTLPAVTVTNPAPRPRVCGEFLVQKYAPLPWAWSGSFGSVAQPARSVRLRVACPGAGR